MAKAAKKQDKPEPPEAEGEEQPPKKKGKLPLILLALVVLLAGGGGAAWFFLSGGSTAEKPQAAKPGPPKPPVFVPLETFTVNLTGNTNEQYLQLMATLKVLDPLAGDAVKQYMPEIRHRILLLLSSKKTSEISSGEGRERLSEEIRQVTNNILLTAAGRTPKPISLEAPAEEAEPAAEAKPEGEAAEDKPQEEGTEPAPNAAPAAAKPAGLAKAASDDPVQSVFFTSFIIQ